MTKGAKIALLVIGVWALIAVGGAVALVVAYISASNTGAKLEANIEMLHTNSENVLSAVTLNIKEQAGVANVYAKDFQDSLALAMSGRYGSDGSKAAMQWIKEQNPTLDSSVYTKIQDIINGGRKEFQTAQTRKLEICRDYKARLNYVVSGAFMRFAGYPKVNLASLCAIVSDTASQKAFQTGVNEPVAFSRASGK